MLTAVEYTQISRVPYVQPIYPGVLVILIGPPAIPQYLRMEMRTDYKEDVHVFREADNVEKALKNSCQRQYQNYTLKYSATAILIPSMIPYKSFYNIYSAHMER